MSSSDDEHYVPGKDGVFKNVSHMTDSDIEKANTRFKKIIESKIDPLPLDNEEFFELMYDNGISLEVTRENPLTKRRLDETVNVINRILKHLHVD